MGGEQGEDFVFHSSDSDDADWEQFLHAHRKPYLNKKATLSGSSTTDDSRSDFKSKITKPIVPTKKRTAPESTSTQNGLHSKRNCTTAHLPMGNGFRHERVDNNTTGSSNPDSSKPSDMSWQNKHSDKGHESSNHVQASGSGQDPSSRSRYHTRPARRNLILSSDSDEEWTERTSDNTTYQSSSNSPEHGLSYQRSKHLGNNPPRKGRAGFVNRATRESGNNNVSQPSTSQNTTGAVSNGVGHNHRLKRGATGNVSGAQSRPSNSDESLPASQATPKNRHMHRLRTHQNRPAATSATSYTGNGASESFGNNIAFRRDDPGRRAFSRSGQPLHGRRSQGSPHHHRNPLLRGADLQFSNMIRRNPDLFDSESTDEGSELFSGSSNPVTRSNFRQTSPRHRSRFQFQTFLGASLPENNHESSETASEPSVVFLSENSVSPVSRNRRRDQGARFTGGSGGRRRRSSRPSHLLSAERSLFSSSPDPVAQVNQLEEDERLARLLQAEFDAELSHNRHGEDGRHLYFSESDADVLVDDEEAISSQSSSSSNNEEPSYSGRRGQGLSRYFVRHQNGGQSETPARGRRRGSRTTAPNPPVTPPRHWHGSPVRGRRGRSRQAPGSSDPLVLQFGRWLGWAILRNLESEDDYEVLWNLAESMGDVVPRGLQRHEINRLPTHKYQPAVAPGDNASGASSSSNNNNGATFTEAMKECRVCLCDYEANELLRVLPCFHEFHAVCIDKWLKNNNTCPVCRAEIALDP